MTDRLTVKLGVVRNLGDYNNVKVDAEYSTDLLSEETVVEAYIRAWTIVEDQVENKIREAIDR